LWRVPFSRQWNGDVTIPQGLKPRLSAPSMSEPPTRSGQAPLPRLTHTYEFAGPVALVELFLELRELLLQVRDLLVKV